MDNNNLSKKLLESIKNENITPKPKWKFQVWNGVLWGAGGLFVIAGGLATSVIIYIFRYSELDVYRQLTDSWTEFLFLFLPIFWLVLLTGTVLVVLYDLKCTKKGYKYPLSLLAVVVVLSSLSLGMVFSYGGVGRYMDGFLGRQVPYYSKVINPRVDFWCHPEQGRLAGIIASITGEKKFVLRGCQGKDWAVKIREVRLDPNGDSSHLLIESGTSVKAIGEKVSESEFMAEKIFPMRLGREFFYRHHSPGHIEVGCPDCMHR
jgi:hypothetical protein